MSFIDVIGKLFLKLVDFEVFDIMKNSIGFFLLDSEFNDKLAFVRNEKVVIWFGVSLSHLKKFYKDKSIWVILKSNKK